MPHATSKTERPPHTTPTFVTDPKKIERLYDEFKRANANLVPPNGEVRQMPGSLYSFLAELIEILKEKKSVMIVRNQANVTTVEAASTLGVSRQFLVNLLEKGEIPFHMVGTHRRIYAQDVFQYKARRDSQRHETIRDLAQAEARGGLYGRTPTSVDERSPGKKPKPVPPKQR
jgi:excisionase family DNA binding protein